MIVGSMYPGDENNTLMNVQHDLYHRHVFAIFDAARQALSFADRLLGTGLLMAEKARAIDYVDHGSLRVAHDIIAATYRYYHDDGGQLLLWDNQGQYNRYSLGWANWFREELHTLAINPCFVLPTVEAVMFENSPMGRFAEGALNDMLITHYHMDKWAPSDPNVKFLRQRLKRLY